MINYHEYKCFTCGKIFEYCRRCVINPIVYKEEGFCSEKCSDIFNILSKHGCGLATAEDTLEALAPYDFNDLSESIQKHMNSLKPAKKVKAQKEVEDPIQE